MQKSPANTSDFFHSNNAMPAKSITGPLQNKAASMQAANVHAILESGPFVQRVQVRLNDSIALIDDLDETLAIFDLKLRHMREDIAAIESRNNRCTSQSSHQSYLQANMCSLSHQPSGNSQTYARRGQASLELLVPYQAVMKSTAASTAAYVHCAGKAAGTVSSRCILR